MTFLRLNDIVIHYAARLVPGRPTVLFVGSLGTDMRIWDAVAGSLGSDFGFVSADKRGHGLSELGGAPIGIETYARDFAALLDHLGLERVTVCGLSIGGLIAQCLYHIRPQAIQGLILCDTGMKIGTNESWNARIEAVTSHGLASVAEPILRLWFTPRFHEEHSAELAGCRTMLVRQDPAGYVAACAAIRDADFTQLAPRIAGPVLCVVGERDGSTPPSLVEAMARAIPGAEFEIIPDAGHIPCVEQPEALVRLIGDFMENRVGRHL